MIIECALCSSLNQKTVHKVVVLNIVVCSTTFIWFIKFPSNKYFEVICPKHLIRYLVHFKTQPICCNLGKQKHRLVLSR